MLSIFNTTKKTMKEIDILYIHPSKFIKKHGLCLIPLGVIPALNFLKEQGMQVLGVNYPMELLLDYRFDLEKILSNLDYSLLVMDLHWHQHSFFVGEISKIIKKNHPQGKIAIGGATASILAREVLHQIKEIDFVIKGDGNVPLLKLWQTLKLKNENYENIPNLFYKDGEKIKSTSEEFALDSLDDLNFTDISFLQNWKHYFKLHLNGWTKKKEPPYFILGIGSGCEYDCLSCGGSKFSHQKLGRKGLLKRSVNKVIEDIEYLYNLGIKKIHLSHSLQIFGEEYWSNLFYLIRKKNIKIGLFTEAWQLPDKIFIDEFSKTFIKEFSNLAFSPMSGNENIRQKFGKLYSNEEMMNSIKKLKNENIPIEIYFSYYLPDEKYKDFFQTLKLINNIRKDYPANILTIYCYPVSVDPGSILFDSPEKHNIELIKRKFIDFYNCSNKLEFLSKISKKMIGYKLKNSNTNPLFLYFLWVFEKIKILFSKLLWKIKIWL